ncbi:MAG TPA: hypothetical protein VN651_00735, partial [Gemmatimonadaceae bacterium]|nr:hypothetical protein [Gemmatimonadaceae bacterium]
MLHLALRDRPPIGLVATALSLSLLAAGCARSSGSGGRAPRAEFLVSTADSTFWVSTTGGEVHLRGAPLLLASYGGHFYELYTADDDYSYQDALLVGERLYRRDIVTDDSLAVLADTTVPRLAVAYAKAHPDERPLDPDEDGDADPPTSATAELDVLDVFGPYLSFEYRVDVTSPGTHAWHATRRGVLDLRTGKSVRVAELFGDSAGARITTAGRSAFETMRDSVMHMRPSLAGDEGRAADALARRSFDERSFTISAVAGEPAVAFGVPARGDDASGNLVELDPVPTGGASWWGAVARTLPTSDDADNDRWTGAAYRVIARYDTSGEVARLSIADTGRREWPVASMLAPLRRIDWLDRPGIDGATRRALSRAFSEASTYDENTRVAAVARVPDSPIHFARAHARDQAGERQPARIVRAHDAGRCEQPRPRVRWRDPVDDGQVR